jgi:ATP-dependent DNA ligase
MVRRDGARVRCFTRNGHEWADRFPAIVGAALRIEAQSFLIDGEAVVVSDDGRPDFHALRTRRTGHAVVVAQRSDYGSFNLHGAANGLSDAVRPSARRSGAKQNCTA